MTPISQMKVFQEKRTMVGRSKVTNCNISVPFYASPEQRTCNPGFSRTADPV